MHGQQQAKVTGAFATGGEREERQGRHVIKFYYKILDRLKVVGSFGVGGLCNKQKASLEK